MKPINFKNENAINEILNKNQYYIKDDYDEEIELKKQDSIIIDLNNIILNPLYSVLWTLKSKYKFIFGAKDNGKSFQCALKIVTKFLANPNRCVAVIRKFQNQHIDSTLPDVLKAFKLISKVSGIKNLIPVNAEDHKKSGRKELFFYTKTNPIKIENQLTGQKISFVSLERMASGGFSLDDFKLAYDTIWVDELVDITNDKRLEDNNILSFSSWQVVESTIFRGERIGKINDDGLLVQEYREGLEWIDYEILFSYNAHTPNHWLLKEYGDKYTPLNPLNIMDCESMERTQIRSYYDPDFQLGKGLFVMRVSSLINLGRNIEVIDQMKKDNHKNYAYLYLGATQNINGLAYSGYESHILIKDLELNKMIPLSIGIDHANSPNHVDYFFASFLATNIKTIENSRGEKYDIVGWDYKYYYHEYRHSNKFSKFKDDETLASDVLEILIKKVEENPSWEHFIKKYGFRIIVDNSAVSFQQVIYKAIYTKMNFYPHHYGWMKKILILPCEGKNKRILIDGEVQFARVGRVERNKRMLLNNMIVFSPKVPWTLESFKNTSYNNKGEVVDKDRDGVDAMDYAEMIEGIFYSFNKSYGFKKNQNNIYSKKDYYNE